MADEAATDDGESKGEKGLGQVAVNDPKKPQLAGWYVTLQSHLGSNPGTVIFATLFFVFFGVIIWRLTSALGGDESTDVNRLVALLGALTGWVVGILFAPFTEAEKTQFQGIAKVVSAFVAGYVLSKIELFVKITLFPNDVFPVLNWMRVGLFLSAFMLGAIIVFVHRLYAFRHIEEIKTHGNPEAEKKDG